MGGTDKGDDIPMLTMPPKAPPSFAFKYSWSFEAGSFVAFVNYSLHYDKIRICVKATDVGRPRGVAISYLHHLISKLEVFV